MISAALIIPAGKLVTKVAAADDPQLSFRFLPNSLVVTRSVYVGTADTITVGETLPPGCAGGPNGTTMVAVPPLLPALWTMCRSAAVSPATPANTHLNDSHNAFNNANTDGSFGVTSPIFLDNITSEGSLLGVLPIPTEQLVTSFSSKSELALNRSVDGSSLTLIGYQRGPGWPAYYLCERNRVPGKYPGTYFPTASNLIDVSASSTPAVCDPTNPVISSFASNPVVPTAYYRAVAEVDATGHISITSEMPIAVITTALA